MKKTSAKSKNTIMRVLKLVKPHMGLAFCQIVTALVNVACTLLVPILIGRAIDLILGEGRVDFKRILALLIRCAAVIAIGALAQYVMSLLSNRMTYRIVYDLRNRVFEHIWKLPLKTLDANSTGDIISRVVADADQFADGMLMGFMQFFTGLATIIGTLCFMFYLNVYITIVVIVVTPLSFLVARYISGHTFKLFTKQSAVRGRQTAVMEEALTLVKTIRTYGCEKEKEDDFNRINDELKDVSMMALFYSSLTNPSTRFVNSICYALVALFGALSVISGGMSVGIWSCFLNYANQYTKPFNEITGVITELSGALACAERIFALLDMEAESDDGLCDFECENVKGSIDIEDADFSYDPANPLIEGFNLKVNPGEKIAIVGPTGCGKTTLINLLMRFYELDGGNISLDGRNICDASRMSLRSSYGMVLQDTWLRNGSIYENIKMGRDDATLEEVIAAAKETGAHSFIRRLDKGYDTVIGEEGGSLSEGQKQLLCVTRIMLIKPPMLILDEATSSIDTRSEIKIQKAFYKLMDGKTSFIVAHRLSTITDSDKIIVMNSGKIVEQGSHEELLEKGGFYAQLYNTGLGKAMRQNQAGR